METPILPLISVIVPCYNVEQYLPKCVDSILAQTYRNLEVILVDDGSPDRCGDICDKYAEKDARVKVIHKANGGVSDARNAALDMMQGEWFTCIDSDDYVSPTYVETLYGLTQKYHCKMAVVSWLDYKPNEVPHPSNRGNDERLLSSDDAIADMFYQHSCDVAPWGKIYKSSLFDDIRYPKNVIYEDLQTTFKPMAKCKEGVAFTNRQEYFYLLRPTSYEGSTFSEMKMDSAINVFNVMRSYDNIFVGGVKSALESKLCSFCFHLVLKMPEGYERGEMLYDYIRKVRWSVLLNNKARLKNRLACASSYLGFKVTKALFSLVDRRK